MLRDLKYALRGQVRDWRYTAMIVLTLAVCVGANTAVFTVVNSVLLQPMPVPNAADIVLMANRYPKAGAGDLNYSAAGDYYDRMRDVAALEHQAMFNVTSRTIESNGIPEQITGIAATPSLWRLVRTPPTVGRAFTAAEGEIGAEQKVILSHALWQQLYGGDRAAIGRELRLSGRPFTIVGVMPREFLFVDPEVRFWIPLAFRPEQRQSYHSNNWYNVGRLKPDATIAQVQAQLNALNAANLDKNPAMKEPLINAGFRTDAEPLKQHLVRGVETTLYLLWAGAALVLLIGAVNIASIVMARTNGRMKEIGTRLALGAAAGRVGKQLLFENLVTAAIGGLAGLGLGAATIQALSLVGLDRMPRASEVRIDGVVVAFALGLAVVTGIVVALAPVAYVSRFSLASVLHDSSRTGSSGRRARSVRQGLVVAQVGLAFVLLTGAGLLLASFRELLKVDPGFSMESILTAATSAPPARYAGAPQLRTLMTRSLEAIRRLPGVVAAGATTGIPFQADYNDSVILAEGYQMKPGESVISPNQLVVTPGYFEAMNIQLTRGRYFDDRDNETMPRVVIVDESLARKFWGRHDPTGRRMYLPSGPDLMKVTERTQWLQVVGVVRSVRLQDLAGGGNPTGVYYFPYAQTTPRSYTFAIKSPGGTLTAQMIRSAFAGIDPALALFDVRTMAERAASSMSSRRASMSLAVGFGGIALFLSAVGIYGVLSYLLAQRRREIGIRMAVGSTQGGIFGLFLREGVVLVAAGLLLGVAGAAAVRKAVDNQVYGVHPLDPTILGAVATLLGAVAISACVWPARQAAKVDPLAALNEQ